MAVVIRTPEGPAAIAPADRETVRRLNPDAVVIDVRPFMFYLTRSVAERRVLTTVVSLFAGIAFALALVGVYGLFSYTWLRESASLVCTSRLAQLAPTSSG